MATKGQINVDFALRFVGAVGANRYVANVSRYSTIAYRDIVQYAARAAHVPESAVDVAMEALFDALSYFVLNGHNVKIDGIGTFAFGVNAKAEINEEDAGANSVHRLKILYLPEMDLRREMNNVVITTSWSNPGNLAEDTEAAKFNPEVLSFGTSKSNVKSIPAYATNWMPKGVNYMVVEGTGLNKDLVRGNVQYYYWDEEEGEPRPAVLPLSSIVQRISKGFGKSTWKIDMPHDAYVFDILLSYQTEDNTYQSRNFYYSVMDNENFIEAARQIAEVMSARINRQTLVDNMTVLPYESGKYFLELEGPDVRQVTVTATGATVVASSSSIGKVTYAVTPDNGVSSITLVFTAEEMSTRTYHISLGESAQSVVVNALSANGVSISNGGSSTVIQGETYNFTLSGLNLNLLTADNLTVPAGSSVRNFAKSANQISFQLVGADEGDISISYNGATIFTVHVTAYTPASGDSTITSIGGVGNNGTYNARGTTGNSLVLPIVGTDLDQLTPASFRFLNGSTFELNEGTATARQLTIRGSMTTGQLLVMNGDTTIFKLNLDFGDEFVL